MSAATKQKARAKPKAVQVAIYTRQSVADDLEFNSLEAQRQAVEAYIESQRSQGWKALETSYDDAGYSGGTAQRPALLRLLEDIESGLVDAVAVYKLDRLSRSINDFVRLMDLFERRGVAFVSTTQSFDTSTSLGRMTVNLLATFATYERDMIRERTRDKIQATRRRGQWTGGRPVLGYDAVEKRLVVNEEEAAVVREVFRLYLELQSALAVGEELKRRGFRTKTLRSKAGREHAGRGWEKQAVLRVLRNPLYAGRVRAGEELVRGEHEALVDEATWEAAQVQLGRPQRRLPPRVRRLSGPLLQGLVRCGACGSAMAHHYTARRGRRYSAYVCLRYQKEGARACPGSRVPVGELEGFVVEKLRAMGRDPRLVRETVASARRAERERRPAVQAEVRRLEREATRLEDERRNLVEAVAGGGAPRALLERVGEAEIELEEVRRELQGHRAELEALKAQRLDEEDLRRALASFDPLWDELFPAEQRRIVELLLERVTYDARAGEVEITFRAGGVRVLAEDERKETA